MIGVAILISIIFLMFLPDIIKEVKIWKKVAEDGRKEKETRNDKTNR